jgi:hypothetical protein
VRDEERDQTHARASLNGVQAWLRSESARSERLRVDEPRSSGADIGDEASGHGAQRETVMSVT